MTTFTRPAVQIKQGNLTLYLTYVTPADLFTDNFYTVDKLEPRSQEGFQRILNATRAARLSRHLTSANDHGYAHLPTTVFLATDKSVTFDDTAKVIRFDKSLVCPFSVVDGQHRIEGLRQASKKEKRLLDFQLPVTIATDLDNTHQMYHFFIVNTTQVPVDPSLRQQITRRFTDMKDIEHLPYMPYWLETEVSRGQDATALKITEFLNDEPLSPLSGRIQMANDPDGRGKIKQSSFINTIKIQILTSSNPLTVQETDVERQSRILLNYFRAVDEVFVAGRDRSKTVVYKSNGVFFFLGISKWIFNAIYSSTKDFTVESIRNIILRTLDSLDDASRVLAGPDWWMSGPNGASTLNRANASRYIDGFQQALARSTTSEDIRL